MHQAAAAATLTQRPASHVTLTQRPASYVMLTQQAATAVPVRQHLYVSLQPYHVARTAVYSGAGAVNPIVI